MTAVMPMQVDQMLQCSFVSDGRQPGTGRQRRRTVGHCHASAAVAAVSRPLDTANKGGQMLRSMGWQDGTGLGANAQGDVLPISLSTQRGRQGLGS